jgi:ureidoglycolate dehydrogenase (NAD+)
MVTQSRRASTSGRRRATADGATLAAPELERWTRALLEASGLEPEPAATVAETLVWTSLRGVDSHGVARVPVYAERLRSGVLNTRPRPAVVTRDGAIAVVDGDHGPGQVAAVLATDLSIELAREHGAGVVSVRRSGHYGAAAFYAMRAAEAGLIGISMTNTEPLVIPFGGVEPALGTNPIAFAAPSAEGYIFNLDMATSQVAINRINNARDEGRAIPEGWGVDEHGEPTTDPAAVKSAVPLGGYKGYGLALMVEVLCGVLSGAGVRYGVGDLYSGGQERQDSGHFHLAIDPERTIGRERFADVLAGLLDELRAIPPAHGFDEVLVAGDPQDRARAERERSGVPIEPALWATLNALSEDLGVPVP